MGTAVHKQTALALGIVIKKVTLEKLHCRLPCGCTPGSRPCLSLPHSQRLKTPVPALSVSGHWVVREWWWKRYLPSLPVHWPCSLLEKFGPKVKNKRFVWFMSEKGLFIKRKKKTENKENLRLLLNTTYHSCGEKKVNPRGKGNHDTMQHLRYILNTARRDVRVA